MSELLDRAAAALRSVDEAIDDLEQVSDAEALQPTLDARLRELRLARRRLLELREKARAESVVPL